MHVTIRPDSQAPDTLTSALGPKGTQIEALSLRLIALMEAEHDQEVSGYAWALAGNILDVRTHARIQHEFHDKPPVHPLRVSPAASSSS